MKINHYWQQLPECFAIIYSYSNAYILSQRIQKIRNRVFKQTRTVKVRYLSLHFHRWEKTPIILTFTFFRVKVTFFDFSIEILFETEMTNGFKFKTRETATTTSPLYTRRHREPHDVTENISAFARRRKLCKDVKPSGLG